MDGAVGHETRRRLMVKRVSGLLSTVMIAMLASPIVALAQGAPGAGAGGESRGLIAIGAGLAIGVAALGCGIGQGRLAASAMESLGRNPGSEPQVRTGMILGLAFVESLSLYALLIAFLMQSKI
jgi:F-type H+-transporting ATPase subunit c